MCGGIPLLSPVPYGKHVDTFTFMLVVLIEVLLTIFEVVKLIHNYAVC